MKLLSTNAKLSKAVSGYLVMGLQLAPHSLSGRNVCSHASAGCKAGCLFTAGYGVYEKIRQARIRKTQFYFNDRDAFMSQLIEEIAFYRRRAIKRGLTLAIRLNTISDISWEKIKHNGLTVMDYFSDVVFYDYTKNPQRAIAYANGNFPPNYSLTFSRSETNEETAKLVASMGCNVAVVFANKPAKLWGKTVIDGDLNDARFLDKKGVIVGLKAKGKARKDKSGFVVA
jgi:hypothetical protein